MIKETKYLDVGNRIRSLRGKQARDSFAKKFSVAPSSLARWESGEAQPDLVFLTRLSTEYDLSLEWFVTGANSSKKSDRSDVLIEKKTQPVGITTSLKKESPTVGDFETPRTPPTLATIGQRIKSLRGEVSLSTFAGRFSASSSNLDLWERGTLQPDVLFLAALARAYSTSVDWLLTGRTLEAPPGPVARQEVTGATPDTEIRELERELRTALREVATLNRERGEWMKERGELMAERERLLRDLEAARSGSAALPGAGTARVAPGKAPANKADKPAGTADMECSPAPQTADAHASMQD